MIATINSTGATALTGVVVHFPAVTGAPLVRSGPSCVSDGAGGLNCPKGTLAGSSSLTETVTYRVAKEGSYSPPVAAMADRGDSVSGSGFFFVGTRLSASASSDSGTGFPQQEVTYGITASENSQRTTALTGVVVTVTLDSSAVFVRSVDGACSFANSQVVCTYPPVPHFGSVKRQIVLILPVTGSRQYPIVATSSGGGYTTSFFAFAQSLVGVSESYNASGPFLLDQDINNTFTFFYNGGAKGVTDTGITLTDTVDPGRTFSNMPPNCQATTGLVVCQVPDLGPGRTIYSLQYAFQVHRLVSSQNSWTMTSARGDLNSSSQSLFPQQPLDYSTAVEQPAVAGSEVTLDITAVDRANYALTATVVTATLGPGLTLIRAPGCTAYGLLVACGLGTVAPHQSSTAKIVVRQPGQSARSIAFVIGDGRGDNPCPFTCSFSASFDTPLATPVSSLPIVATGDEVTFTVAAANRSETAALAGVSVDVSLPFNATVVRVPPSCTGSGTTRTCTIGALGIGQSVTLPFVVTFTSATFFSLSTSGHASGLSNSFGSAFGEVVVPLALRGAAGSVGFINGAVNDEITVTAAVVNRAIRPIHGVVLTDTLNQFVTVVRAPGCAVTSATVVCPVGDIAGRQEATATIVVRYNQQSGFQDAFTASSADGGPPAPLNQTVVVRKPLEFTFDWVTSASSGQEVTVSVSATNYTGTTVISPVTVTDDYDAAWSIVRLSPDCSDGGTTVTCTSTVPPQSVVTEVIVLTTQAPSGSVLHTSLSGSGGGTTFGPATLTTFIN
jgi:uncharacterized repeat protein (TIGR01451 family)